MSRTPTRGQRFAEAVRAEFELGIDEAELLTEAARTLDLLDVLDTVIANEGPVVEGSRGQSVLHPALTEARQARLVLVRILGSLGLALADDEGSQPIPTPAQLRGRQAAAARWGQEAAKARRRNGSD